MTQDWFLKKVKVISWPSQPPDLNLTENVWRILKLQVEQRNPCNFKKLKVACQKEYGQELNHSAAKI